MKWKYRNNESGLVEEPSTPIQLIMNTSGGNENWNMPEGNIKTVDNKILFYGDLDEQTALELNKTLMETDVRLQNTKNMLGDDYTPICHLHVSTLGGEILPAFSIVDTIRNMNSKVYTYVDGQVASAGTFIVAAGEKRFMGKYAHVLIHQLSGGMYGKFSEMEDEIYNLTNLMKLIKSFYKDHTKIPMKKLDELLKRDIWLNPEECKELGIIDEIL